MSGRAEEALEHAGEASAVDSLEREREAPSGRDEIRRERLRLGFVAVGAGGVDKNDDAVESLPWEPVVWIRTMTLFR